MVAVFCHRKIDFTFCFPIYGLTKYARFEKPSKHKTLTISELPKNLYLVFITNSSKQVLLCFLNLSYRCDQIILYNLQYYFYSISIIQDIHSAFMHRRLNYLLIQCWQMLIFDVKLKYQIVELRGHKIVFSKNLVSLLRTKRNTKLVHSI